MSAYDPDRNYFSAALWWAAALLTAYMLLKGILFP